MATNTKELHCDSPDSGGLAGVSLRTIYVTLTHDHGDVGNDAEQGSRVNREIAFRLGMPTQSGSTLNS